MYEILTTFRRLDFVVRDMSSSNGHSHGHGDPMNSQSGESSSSCANSRTSLKTMAVVVVVIAAVALIGRFGSSSLSQQSFTDTTGGSSGTPQNKEEEAPASQAVRPIDCTFINNIASQIERTKAEITTFWNVSHYPNFMSTMNIPSESWKIQKAKYVKLLLEANTNFVDRAEGSPGRFNVSFVAGFSGSSVTAGHDNYFHEAFPQVFEDTLSPVFRAMQVPFTVRNHALGNNPCYPYDACIATHLGEDLDLLAWEQSMNCGRYPTPVDTFARSAYHMPRKPTLLFLTSGGPVWTRQDCLARNITTSGVRGLLTAAEQSLLAHSTEENALVNPFFRQSTFLKDDDKNLFVDRFAQLAPMAQSVFGLEEYKCLGPYNASFCEKTPGGGATHHPGKLMHKLRGENLAFFQLEMLLDALRDLQGVSSCASGNSGTGEKVGTATAGSSGSSENSGTRSGKRMRRALHAQHPVSSSNGDANTLHTILSVAFNLTFPAHITTRSSQRILHTPTATHIYNYITDYLHTTQSPPLPPVPSHYNLPEIAVPPLCHTNYQPRMSHPISDIIVHSNWAYDLSFLDKAAVEKSVAKGRGYQDLKYVFSSVGANSSIALSVSSNGIPTATISTTAAGAGASGTTSGGTTPKNENTPIWLCEVQKGFARYPATHADLNVGASVYIQYNHPPTAVAPASIASADVKNGTINTSTVYKHPDTANMVKLELSQVKNECYRTGPVPPGRHLLTIVQNSDKIVNLAYVISW